MSRQYKRIYDLVILPTEGESRTIRDLRIRFDITKSVLSYPNLGKIEIYNANQDTLSSLQRKFTKVTLNAGYEGNSSLIFKGEVRNVLQSKVGVDRIVTIFAGDGERDWQNSYINKTYSDTVTVKTIVNDTIATFKDTVKGIVEGVPEIADKLMGETLSGSSKDVLDNITKQYGLEWSILDGEINVSPVDQPIASFDTVVINSTTGMIGSPTVTEIGADVTILLNPNVKPKSLFEIQSSNADVKLGNLFFRNVKKTSAEGVYITQEVNYKGDSREGVWVAMLKGRRASA